jgi:hypothetical protein
LRGADRQKLELALAGRTQFDIVHFCGHGGQFVLAAGDGLLPEAELVTLMEAQKVLQFIVVGSCDGLEVAGALHNSLHVPCVAFTGEILDQVAIEFSRAFYRAWRGSRDVRQAVERGREALAVLHPGDAQKVRLINGDMVTPSEFGACMGKIDERLDAMGVQLSGIEGRLERIEGVPERWLFVGVALIGVLIVVQVATPFIASALRAVGR